jgi:hypothetical protein
MSDTSKSTRDDSRNEKLVSAKPGTEAYTKTGGSAAVDTDGGPSVFNPRSADEENLAAGPKSPTDPNYLEALRKTEGGQEKLDEVSRGTDGDSTYGPTGDVTTARKDAGAKTDGDHYDHTGKDDSNKGRHTDRNPGAAVNPAAK